MSIIKWKTDIGRFGSSDAIERVECTRETDSTVWVLEDSNGWFDKQKGKPPQYVERRRVKYGNYHDTWEDAHAALMRHAEESLQHARTALARAQGHHGNIKGMKKPEGA